MSIPQQPNKVQTRVMVIDLEHRRLIADRILPQMFIAVATDDERVYVAPGESATILVLSCKDLSELRRVFTPKLVRQLTAMGGRILHAGMDEQSLTYRADEMTPLEMPSAAFHPLRPQQMTPTFLGDAWISGGVI